MQRFVMVKNFLHRFEFVQDNICFFISVIHLGNNPIFHNKFKHIDVRNNWIHEVLDSKLLELAKDYNDDNDFDMITKDFPIKFFTF